MAVPTDEQIQKWRERWEKHPKLVDEIVSILMEGDRPPENTEEAADRLWRVNAILPQEDFDVYEGEGEELGEYEGEFVIGPVLYLRGIDLSGKSLKGVYLGKAHLEGAYLSLTHLEGAYLIYAHLKGANLSLAHLEGACLIDSHLEGADLSHAHLEGANLIYAHLEVAKMWSAHLEGAKLGSTHLEGAYLRRAHLEGAELIEVHLEGANLSYAKVGKLEKFDEECNLDDKIKEQLIGRTTTFADTEFLPKWRDFAFLKCVCRKDWWLFNIQRWFYTDFKGVRIDDADTVMAADLRRYVNDQHYLRRIKTKNPPLYWLWTILSGCGNNIWLLLIWAFLLICLFAWFYCTIPWTVPEWMMSITPDFMFIADPPIDPKPYVNHYPSLSEAMKWFFVSFDIFTNLGIRNTHPQNNIGVILVFLETVLGFSTLGVLIAVATNKWVRRS